MTKRRVVITGLGPVTAIGAGVSEYWNGLLDGKSGVRAIDGFDAQRFDSRLWGEIAELKLGNFVPKTYRKAGKIMARDIVLAVAAAYEAVRDAGLITKCIVDRGEAEGAATVRGERFGANIGAGLICADLPELAEALASAAKENTFDIRTWGSDGMRTLTPLWLLKFLPNMLACHVTIVHDCRGPSNTITCGEASSHLAIGEAYRVIERGVADVCIAGGAESKTNPMALLRQSLGGRLSTHNDDPAGACRPFGAKRDGTVVSEGGGLVILEDLEHAKQRGARIYAELVGFGASNDAHDPNQPSRPHPEGRGLQLALRKALKDADTSADAIDLVTAFACGLHEHDAVEAHAVAKVLGDRAADVPVVAIKGALGNNGAGSGTLDFIAATLALHHNTVPTSLNADPLDSAVPLNVVTNGPRDARVDCAVSYSYALGGGQNAALLIKKYSD